MLHGEEKYVKKYHISNLKKPKLVVAYNEIHYTNGEVTSNLNFHCEENITGLGTKMDSCEYFNGEPCYCDGRIVKLRNKSEAEIVYFLHKELIKYRLLGIDTKNNIWTLCTDYPIPSLHFGINTVEVELSDGKIVDIFYTNEKIFYLTNPETDNFKIDKKLPLTKEIVDDTNIVQENEIIKWRNFKNI